MADPTFSNHSVSPSRYQPDAVVTAGGDLWYLEKSTPAGQYDSIGRMTTTGVTTDYAIGGRPLQTNSTVDKLIVGPDGNVWFAGSDSGGGFIGKLDISTGVVSFYAAGGYSSGALAAGPDGKIYFTYKSSGAPANSRLCSLNPTTGAIAVVETFDTYANIRTSMATGPDSRLYIVDAYYGRVYARSLSGGANNTFNIPNVDNVTSGLDGNVWLTGAGKIVKMTTSGVTADYTLPAGTSARKLIAGPDGAMWFLDSTKIGRITTAGAVTSYAIPGTGVGASGLTLGPDGAVWFSYKDSAGAYLGRLGY